MFKTKLSLASAIVLADKLKNEDGFGFGFIVSSDIDGSVIMSTEELTSEGAERVNQFIRAFEHGVKSVESVLNEIQEHAELITAKINQL